MWPFKRKSKEPAPEPQWKTVSNKVGNCPVCGAPVYELSEELKVYGSKCGPGYNKYRIKDPPEILYACDCREVWRMKATGGVVRNIMEVIDESIERNGDLFEGVTDKEIDEALK